MEQFGRAAWTVTKRKQTAVEEIANASIHGAGALFAAAGLVVLILRAVESVRGVSGGAKIIFACALYAATLVILFLSSTLYHALAHEKAKRILKILDHSAIYLLIAGTYTPICLIVLPKVFGLCLAAAEWLLAATGIVFHVINVQALKKAEVALYLFMGWALVAGGPIILYGIPPAALILLLTGGVLFSLGVYFYKKHERKFFHVIWHLFVLAACALQWGAVFIISRI